MKTKTLLALFLLLSFSVYSQGTYSLSAALALPENEYHKVKNLNILGENKVYILPSEIFKFSNLERLYLYELGIRKIDVEIFKLKKLKVLFIENCKNLETLPQEISKLPITELHIVNCINLKDFSFLSGLSLKQLSLDRCSLFDLPDYVKGMSELTYLSLYSVARGLRK